MTPTMLFNLAAAALIAASVHARAPESTAPITTPDLVLAKLDGKGKGLIGALNYLAAEGVKAFRFLTYNMGGDGSNV